MEGSISSNERKEFSREELLRLLSYLEGEVQARDVVIAALKSEKAKQLLYQAKYGRLAGDDPISALHRDSNLADAESELDEAQVGQMYESQLSQLERLISVQRRCHSRSKQILAATERRHARILRELDDEKQRSAADAAQGDDLCALLENERIRLRQQLEYEQKENDKGRKEIERLEKKLFEEKERHKSMVLFLINERKRMFVRMHELRMHSEHGANNSLQEGALLAEMRKELNALRTERDQLLKALSSARTDVHTLKEVVRSQEEDLALMRNSILASSRPHTNNLRVLADGSVVVTNKAASNSLPPTKSVSQSNDIRNGSRSKISTSSSFPSGERNAPPSRVPLPSTARPATSLSSTVPPSPTRRHATSSSSSATRSTPLSTSRNVAPTTDSSSHRGSRVDRQRTSYVTEPEIEQLGAVIDSMNSKTNKRSASLPRSNVNGMEGVHSTKQHNDMSNSSSKSIGAPRRSVLFKAFGVTTKSDRNDS
uniref:CortBP2 domain-containing protein n=1 Tax=Ascaris lumbricoides TaxID=6252 RepID=A0A0M3IN93_ASCLU